MIQERRKNQRAKTELPLKIADKAFDVITETVNISPSGMYCRITRFLPLMSKIEVIVLVPSKNNGKQTKKIKCKGIVVRTEPILLQDTDKAHYNVAIFFTDVSKKDRDIMGVHIDSGNKDEQEVHITN